MHTNPLSHRRQGESQRLGSILILSTAVLVMVLAFAAFTIDVGYIALTKAQMQNAVDSAALAAAQEFDPQSAPSEVERVIREAAAQVAARHDANGSPVYVDPSLDVELGRRVWNVAAQEYETEWGPDAVPWNVVRVNSRMVQRDESGANGASRNVDRRLPLFFAPVIGHKKAQIEVSAEATFQPRDIVLVHDYSGSMNDDSEFRNISLLGRAEVEKALRQQWTDLGSPAFGTMSFDPQYVTGIGIPQNGTKKYPHIEVTWKGSSVDVVSTKSIIRVLMFFEGGGNQTKTGSSSSATFSGSGSYSGRIIEHILVESWGNKSLDPWYGTYGELFSFDVPGIKKHLGLTNVPYPYAKPGSWDPFIRYVKSTDNDDPYYSSHVGNAGYRRKFGIMCLINFWNEKFEAYSETPILWKTGQQPVTCLKDAADVLLDYLIDSGAEDNVGFVAYTHPSGGSILESPMTQDYSHIKSLSRARQAGHYYPNTNIAAGMIKGRQEIVANARPRTYRVMLLMTDGIANESPNNYSPYNACIQEAYAAKEAKIKIMTVSVGVGADTGLMQEIADITGGKHFNVPGGTTVAAMAEDLKQAFNMIASDRPLRLIHEENSP